MTIYKNKNEDSKSIFASVDFDDSNGTAFFTVKSEADVKAAKEILEAAGQSFVAKSYVKGKTVIITQGSDSKEDVIKKISSSNDSSFELEPKEKQTSLEFVQEHGWKMRGGSSIIGQTMTLFSALRTPEKDEAGRIVVKDGKLSTKFDPATGAFAALNLAANFINLVFGGQKEEDVHGLAKFDKIIADEVNHYLPNDKYTKISPEDVRKLSYMTDSEVEEHNKDRSAVGVLKRNSVKMGEVGLRTLGSVFLVLNYKTLGKGLKGLFTGKTGIKDTWDVIKTTDNYTRTAGYGMVAGKAMGLLAETYDSQNPPKTYWQEIKQKVLWRVSSFTEMVAQSSFVYDRAKNKKIVLDNKLKSDYVGSAGNVLLTVPPYPARLVLPYGHKVLDVDEIHARLLDELPKLPKDKVPEVMARVTARMVEHMGESSPEFSELYKTLSHKLKKYHNIEVLPHGVDNEVGATTKAAEINSSEKKFADKIAPAQKNDFAGIKKNDFIADTKNMLGEGHVAAIENQAIEPVMAR